MNKVYGKIVDGKFVQAPVERFELADGRGYTVRYISDADLASGEYKEVLTRGVAAPNAEALVRAGRLTCVYEDVGAFIIRTYVPISSKK